VLTNNNLSNILREKKITLAQLAENTDIPVAIIDEVYLGHKDFTPEILNKISDYLQVPQETLLLDNKKSIYDNIGIQLRHIREEKKITLVQLGKRSGVSYTHISEIERGKTCASLKTLEKLAVVLEIPTRYFFQLEESFTLGDKIRRLRERQNLTQVQLAEKIGVSLSLIGQIETGRVKPALDTLQEIANVFGVGIYYFLMTETEEMALRQANSSGSHNSYDKFIEITQDLQPQDFSLVVALINVLRTHNRLNIEEEALNDQTKELLEIMANLSEDDKKFVIENSRWVLKKAKSNNQ